MKQCSKCGATKSREEFYARAGHTCGECKECTKAARKRYRAENAEKVRAAKKRDREKNRERDGARIKAWRAAHPERVEELRQRWLKGNPERANDSHKARHKKWRDANPELLKALWQRWYTANKETAHAISRTKRARKRGAEGHHTAEDIRAIWVRQENKCAVPNCPYPIDDVRGSKHHFHVDHVIPLKPRSGPKGTNWPDNLQILCPFHNGQKHTSDPYEFAQKHGTLFL